MYRYFAFHWDEQTLSATALVRKWLKTLKRANKRWTSALSGPGFEVLHCIDDDRMGVALSSPHAVILGNLHPHDSIFNNKSVETTHLASQPYFHYITNNYWGDYVSFHQDPNGDCGIYCAPCGYLPCMTSRHDNVQLFFSDIIDALPLIGHSLTLNRQFLIDKILSKPRRLNTTGLNEVSLVEPGQAILLTRKSQSLAWIWNAADFYEKSPIFDYSQAKVAIRDSIFSTTKAMANEYNSLLIWLSGGLDSTLLINVLRKVAPNNNIVCVNNHFSVTGGDERYYAQLAAKQAAYPLIERLIDPQLARIDALTYAIPSAIIHNYTYPTTFLESDLEIASTNHLQAIFSGIGGDSIFHMCRDVEVAQDCLLEKGLSGQFFETCYNLAKGRKKTVYSIAARSLIGSLKRSSNLTLDSQITEIGLVNVEIINETMCGSLAKITSHALSRFRPGKQMQIDSLFSDSVFYPSISHPRWIHSRAPYLSQPVAEVCLRIPTYLLSYNGISRSLIRDAFSDLLPAEIRNRIAKGDMSQWACDLIRIHKKFFYEFFLNGELVRHGLLNRDTLEKALKHPDQARMTLLHHINSYIDMETWLKAWARAGVATLR